MRANRYHFNSSFYILPLQLEFSSRFPAKSTMKFLLVCLSSFAACSLINGVPIPGSEIFNAVTKCPSLTSQFHGEDCPCLQTLWAGKFYSCARFDISKTF